MRNRSILAALAAMFLVAGFAPATSLAKPPGLDDLIKCGWDDGAWRCDIPPK